MDHQKLPDLPYDFSALEPVISTEIMTLHYTKHHATYVAKLNEALDQYAQAESENNLSKMIQLEPIIRFNGGGHLNHSIFWTNLAPTNEGGGSPPTGELAKAIDNQFGDLQKFIDKMSEFAVPIQGSGWAWLGFCPINKRLEITTCPNQDPLATKGLIPLLGIDVWEHAYYLQYKNVRPNYVKAIWNIINWKNVEARYSQAVAGRVYASV
ncbi:superoxide dismutase [Chlamydiales bacterium]|nr:superoxide dismutase [Chlamydiales bacterium]